jgi:hypothetical protein
MKIIFRGAVFFCKWAQKNTEAHSRKTAYPRVVGLSLPRGKNTDIHLIVPCAAGSAYTGLYFGGLHYLIYNVAET